MTTLEEIRELNEVPFTSNLNKYTVLRQAMREWFETNDFALLIEIKKLISC